jgi:hypothetical protein
MAEIENIGGLATRILSQGISAGMCMQLRDAGARFGPLNRESFIEDSL